VGAPLGKAGFRVEPRKVGLNNDDASALGRTPPQDFHRLAQNGRPSSRFFRDFANLARLEDAVPAPSI